MVSMIRSLLRRRVRNQRGNAILEFLMLVPAFFILIILFLEMIIWYLGIPFVGSTMEMFSAVRNEALMDTHESPSGDLYVPLTPKKESRKFWIYVPGISKTYTTEAKLYYVKQR